MIRTRLMLNSKYVIVDDMTCATFIAKSTLTNIQLGIYLKYKLPFAVKCNATIDSINVTFTTFLQIH